MQIGPSRELFEFWAPDPRNGLIITGYSVEGTLARVSDILLSIPTAAVVGVRISLCKLCKAIYTFKPRA